MVGGQAAEIVASDFAAPSGDGTLDLSLAESDAEAALMSYIESRSRTAAKSLVAQPLLDTLVTACDGRRATRRAGHPRGESQRRCDFVFLPRGSAPTVIEVDGTQHSSARAEDRKRDSELGKAGVNVLRIPTSKLRGGTALLPAVDDLIASVPETHETNRMVWGAVQTHRLVAAICEALTAGLLDGDTWSIALIDGTKTAASLVGPYLGLLAAVDAATGGRTAPATARLGTGDKVIEWRRVGPYRYERRDTNERLDPRQADLRIALQYEKSSCDVLPASDETATVIVRSCAVPGAISDPTSEPLEESAPDAEGEVPREAVEAVSWAVFGMSELRAGQYEAINELLCGRDCVVLLPTGGGKSLIYQVAGLLTTGRTLVVDPIVSLINDQVAGLAAHGIDRSAAVYHGSDELEQSKDAHWVFVAPERLQRTKFRDSLKENAADAPIRLAVVDEAHCVSEWGHSFRPAYLNFGRVLRAACEGVQGPPRIAALTGTASRPVLADLLHHLAIANSHPNSIVKPDSFDRPELSYEVAICSPEQQMGALREAIGSLPARFGVSEGEFFAATGSDADTYSGIVFVPRVNGRMAGIDSTAKEIAAFAGRGMVPARYSGNAPKSEDSKAWDKDKARHAASFKSNETPVMVATKAFGMGIDKANVRYTVHLGLPQSIEGFYQEAGRAGRDGRPARCLIVMSEVSRDRSRRILSTDEGKGDSSGTRDDITTVLWFHNSNFPAASEERAAMLEVYEMLQAGQRTIPFRPRGRDNGKHHDDGRVERALHRLAVLGVVNDYTVDGAFEGTSATVTVGNATPESIGDALTSFVGRVRPGGAEPPSAYRDVRHAVEKCSRQLIDTLYDTVVKSRKRSLREMWLLAIDAERDGEIVRQRVLDYLTEGAAASRIEELITADHIDIEDWTAAWDDLVAPETAAETRSATARLLASYPEHPGLLATRAVAEGAVAGGDLNEFDSSLRAALDSLSGRYASSGSPVAAVLDALLQSAAGRRRFRLGGDEEATRLSFAAVTVVAGLDSGNDGGAAIRWLQANWRRSPDLAALWLRHRLEPVAAAVTDWVQEYRGGNVDDEGPLERSRV